MVYLFAGTKKQSFEYTGCNDQVTVEQLRRYLTFEGIKVGPNARKKDLCNTVDALLKAVKQARQNDEIPIYLWYRKESASDMKKRLRGCSPKTMKQEMELKQLVQPKTGKKKSFFARLFGL